MGKRGDFLMDPEKTAFDIDGVVADTMSLFIDLARTYGINIRYEEIRDYNLSRCLDIDDAILKEIIVRLLDGDHEAPLKPMAGAARVLGKMAESGPVLFVTARPYTGPMEDWIRGSLLMKPGSFEIVAAGSFEAKAPILKEKGISFFVEDRLETCHLLAETGITPVLFHQPWNRENRDFIEVRNWEELGAMIRIEAGSHP